MSIEVTCPQGHKIACNEEMIGKSVKCPSCETAFRVTDPHESKDRGTANHAGQEDSIAFLCPNGHKLNSPASLQGKAGKCPHCGARFLIPDYTFDDNDDLPHGDEDDLTAATDDAVANDLPVLDDLQPLDGLSEAQDAADLPAAANPIAMQQATGQDPFAFVDAASPLLDVAPTRPASASVAAVGLHPMAFLFESLWARRTPKMKVELQLGNGEKVRPDHYSADFSKQFQGVFAIKQDDDTYSITAIAWDAVQQVTLQRIPELPTDMFPG